MILVVGKCGYLPAKAISKAIGRDVIGLFDYDPNKIVSDDLLDYSDLALMSEAYKPSNYTGSSLRKTGASISALQEAGLFQSYDLYLTARCLYEAAFRHAKARYLEQAREPASLDWLESFNTDIDKATIFLSSNRVDMLIFSHMPHSHFHIALYFVARWLSATVYVMRDSSFAYGMQVQVNPLDYWPNANYKRLIPIQKLSALPFFFNSPSKLIAAETHQALSKLGIRDSAITNSIVYSDSGNATNYSDATPPTQADITSTPRNDEMVTRQSIFEAMDRVFRFRGSEFEASSVGLQFSNNLPIRDKAMPSLEATFIFMTLSVQPEATTSVLGRFYEDQLCYIRRIVEILPEGWLLYIKDHPLNRSNSGATAYARNQRRWEGYLSNPKIRFVPYEKHSSLYASKARCVAIVSGSSGIESLERGTPIIYGGDTEYYSFSNAKPIEYFFSATECSDSNPSKRFLEWLDRAESISFELELRRYYCQLFAGYAYFNPSKFSVSIESNASIVLNTVKLIADSHYGASNKVSEALH
jgi:hypothetical protein